MLWTHIKTVFSFRFYQRLSGVTRGQAAWFGAYLFLLSVLACHIAAGGYIRKNLPVLLKNFPEVTFEKGTLVSPKTPVFAAVPQSDFVIMFDASRKTPPSLEEMTRKGWLMSVGQDALYMPGSFGVQTRRLPPELSFTSTPEFLARQEPLISGALRAVAFTASLLIIPFVMLFGFCLAGATGLFFKLLRRSSVPRAVILRWAFFMLGPLSVLWYVRLWVEIPLFTFAQLILCVIYMQQIFNMFPEDR